MRILAISLDLDDTLWPIEPAIVRAEARLDGWLREHCPLSHAAFPIPAMRALRDRIATEHPHLSHDFTAQRKLSLRAALEPHGYGDDHVAAAFEEYYAGRHEVDLYPDALPALHRLAAQLPLASLTNGNADLERLGLHGLFAHRVSAREHGTAKPEAAIFLSTCERLGVAPENVLHVGDDPLLDVIGAHGAGLHTAWINRHEHAWTDTIAPDLTFTNLAELADWLDRHRSV